MLFAPGAAWLVVALELAIVFLLRRREIASVWELTYALIWLLPLVTALSGSVGLLGGAFWRVIAHAPARLGRRLAAVLTGLAGGFLGYGVGGGRHLSALPVRLGFAVAFGLVVASLSYAALPWIKRQLDGSRRWVPAAALIVVLGCELANRLILVRLYPAFHLGLALATLLVAPLLLASRVLARPPSRPWESLIAALAVILAAGLSPFGARKLSYFDNLRLLLLEQAPLAAQGLRVAALIAPPPPIATFCEPGEPADSDCLSLGPPRTVTARSLDFRGRDVLLITVDALRADHVGAYGYSRKLTPHIDALAREGTLFEYAYCPTPHTSYSVTSMLTGKYMRPLLLQGAGADSDTLASVMRGFGYHTAAFYPPAVFFVDPELFKPFSSKHLDFEYVKQEFLEGDARVKQVERYLDSRPNKRRVVIWVHLFGPHEPYQKQPGHDFGDRDLDRYDSEIAAADDTIGKLVAAMRRARPESVVVISADHGEEFDEHGGRYHGTSVYEEQVRVPLIFSAPGQVRAARLKEPVQTIDIMPTLLSAVDVPRPPRLRGRDLGPLMTRQVKPGPGLALAETEEFAMLAEDRFRLVCARRLSACKLFDVQRDPGELTDLSSEEPHRVTAMKKKLAALGASHGRYEVLGLRAEGRGWPAPILRGITGDGEAAEEIAALLDDADVVIRRKAAELLFQLRRPEVASALRLTLSRDEDPQVKAWCALGLTRLGQGAPLAFELVKSDDKRWQRLAALALAESGDKRGEQLLIAWWKDKEARDYERSRELLDAFAEIRSKDAVWPLVQSLNDVRLRPYIADTLATIGQDVARVPLARALEQERYQGARIAIARALVKLGAEAEMARPLQRFLGVPDPLPGGVEIAQRAKITEQLGGPGGRDLKRLREGSELGVALTVVVPKGGNGQGVRALVRARNHGREPADLLIGPREMLIKYNRKGEPIKSRNLPRIISGSALRLEIPTGTDWVEIHGTLPAALEAKPGRGLHLVVFAETGIEVDGLVIVPLADELEPPAPRPWQPAKP